MSLKSSLFDILDFSYRLSSCCLVILLSIFSKMNGTADNYSQNETPIDPSIGEAAVNIVRAYNVFA